MRSDRQRSRKVGPQLDCSNVTVTEKAEVQPLVIRNDDVDRDCRSTQHQLVFLLPLPKNKLLRLSYSDHQQLTTPHEQRNRVSEKTIGERSVQFVANKMDYEPCAEYSSENETLSKCRFLKRLRRGTVPGDRYQ